MHVAGPQHWVEARARLSGWRAAIYDADLRPFEPLLGDWTAESGYAAGQALAQHHGVTAVFVANDHMAIGVLRALSEAGRRVPMDISVVGFDDIPESGFLIPPLTTVRQDFTAVGRLAIDTLQVAMRPETADRADLGVASRRGRLISPELVLRESTARVPGTQS
jgi:DNA-binding LacI/PurR family transcriptional regulator